MVLVQTCHEVGSFMKDFKLKTLGNDLLRTYTKPYSSYTNIECFYICAKVRIFPFGARWNVPSFYI